MRYDEFIISYDIAVKPLRIDNKSNKELILFKFYSKGINIDIPMISLYKI